VFTNNLNLKFGERMIALCNPSVPRISFGIALGEKVAFNDLGMNPGDKVQVIKDEIKINSHYFSFNNADRWDARLKFPLGDREQLTTLSHVIERCIMISGHKGGLGEICLGYIEDFHHQEIVNGDKLMETLGLILRKLEISYAEENAYGFASALRMLVGLGVGLTPSGDDFIVGLLSLITACENTEKNFPNVSNLVNASISDSLSRTSDISREFLYFACKKEFSEPFHELYKNALFPDERETFASAIRLGRLGQNSGIEGLSGVLFGIRLLLDKEVFPCWNKEAR